MRVTVETDRRPDLTEVAAAVRDQLALTDTPPAVGRDAGQPNPAHRPDDPDVDEPELLPGVVSVDVPDDAQFTPADLQAIVDALDDRPDPAAQRRADLDTVKSWQGPPAVRDALVRLLGG